MKNVFFTMIFSAGQVLMWLSSRLESARWAVSTISLVYLFESSRIEAEWKDRWNPFCKINLSNRTL